MASAFFCAGIALPGSRPGEAAPSGAWTALAGSRPRVSASLWILITLAILPATASTPSSATDEAAAFETVAGIFERRCAQCHTGAHPKMRLRLDRDSVYRATVNVPSRASRRQRLIAPGDPWSSALYLRLLPRSEGAYRGPRMPMKGSLSEAEIASVRAWIESFPAGTWGPSTRMNDTTETGVATSWRESTTQGASGSGAESRGGSAPSVPTGTAAADERSGGELGPPPEATSRSATADERPRLFAPLFHDRFLASLPSPDTLGRSILEYRFTHRFKASVSEAGADNLWGLDSGAWISIGLAYGLGDRFDIGVRRTNQMQDYEAYFKTALIRQRTGGAPVSMALYGSFMRLDADGLENRNRWSEQIVIARRFAEWLSVEIVPTYVAHTNFHDAGDRRGTLALGVGAELRLNSFLALTGEWVGQKRVRAPRQAGSIGFSVQTSNHVFHVLFTNAQNTHTDLYAPGGDLDWDGGDFRIGFNISRTFDPMHP